MKNRIILHVTLFASALFIADSRALQAQAAVTPPNPQAQQVPLSGRSQGGGTVTALASALGTSSSVDTVNTTVQVQGAYQGSVPGPVPTDGPISLTIGEAIQRGLQYNLGGLASSASVQQLRGQRLSALSRLLPDIYGSISETGAKTDLQTLGLSSGALGGNLLLPTTVGPYHYYSAQANINEQVDLTDLHNVRSANAALAAGRLNAQDARELIVLAAGGSYLRVIATQAMIVSQENQVQYAEASYKQAKLQQEAGTKAVIDADRSLVELQTEQQRLSSERAQLIKDRMALERIIGLPPGRELRIVETLPSTADESLDIDVAIRTALDHRADLQAANLQLKAAQESLHASKLEYLPSASVNGDYGIQGINPNKGAGVFQASGTVTIPIWRAGRVRADVDQAEAAVSQRKAEYTDQRGVVENDVRIAILDLKVAVGQVSVAANNRQLALRTLEQSQDRFAAGVTTSVEVVQSQESLASAEQDYINSLFSLNVGKISLGRSLGQAEATIHDLLKGQ